MVEQQATAQCDGYGGACWHFLPTCLIAVVILHRVPNACPHRCIVSVLRSLEVTLPFRVGSSKAAPAAFPAQNHHKPALGKAERKRGGKNSQDRIGWRPGDGRLATSLPRFRTPLRLRNSREPRLPLHRLATELEDIGLNCNEVGVGCGDGSPESKSTVSLLWQPGSSRFGHV